MTFMFKHHLSTFTAKIQNQTIPATSQSREVNNKSGIKKQRI